MSNIRFISSLQLLLNVTISNAIIIHAPTLILLFISLLPEIMANNDQRVCVHQGKPKTHEEAIGKVEEHQILHKGTAEDTYESQDASTEACNADTYPVTQDT